jgi:outer membrane lipoprotein-sorting protein
MRFKLFFFWLCSLIFFLGCAGGKKTNITKPVLTDISNWPIQFEENHDKINSLEGSARLTIESEEFSGHISLKTYWVKPDTFFIQAEGPLGLDIGKMFIGKSRFIIYNQFENQFITGSVNDPYLGKFLQTDIYLKDLKQAILGRPLNFSPSLRLTDRNSGIFRKRIGDKDYRYIVNPATGLLERLEILKDSQLQIIEEFKNYRSINDIYTPFLVQITLPTEKQRISIFYNEIIFNKPIDSKIYTIDISPKVRQLNLN